MLYTIQQVTVTLGGREVLSKIQLEIHGSEKIALVGPNGAGKTTLLRLIAGEITPDRNDKYPEAGIYTSRQVTIDLLRQQPVENEEETVREHLLEAYLNSRGLDSDSVSASELYERELFTFETEYHKLFTGFGFAMEDCGRRMGEFSGGQQTRIALIRLLLMQPDILLLDEPTNHLDFTAVEWLEDYLASYPKAVVMVSHDRYFLDRTAQIIYELRRGRLTRYVGGYSSYLAQRQKNYEIARRRYQEQQEEVERLEDLIRKFRNKPRKAAFARSRRKILERMEQMEKPEEIPFIGSYPEILPAQLGSKWVWEGEDAVIGYEEALRKVTFRIRRGQKIGILGPNGTGKSTFLKTISGQIPLLQGKMILGQGIDMAYFDQQTAAMESPLSVLNFFRERYPIMTEKDARTTLGRYGLKGRDVMKIVSELSGGEKTRFVLALLLTAGPNFLLLDEPTNHLDVEGMEQLEQILASYRGTVLVVSHDRYFLSRTAESLLVFEENGSVLYYPFDYDHYRQRRNQAKHTEDMSAIRTAEEQRMIDDLKAVPRAEIHRLRGISSEEGYMDWQFRWIREELEAAMNAVESSEKGRWQEAYWIDSVVSAQVEKEIEAADAAWTEGCIRWYDLWIDSET